MKKRILSFVLVFLIISVTLGYSSDALLSKIDIPKVDVGKDSERVSSEGLTRYVYGAGLVASVKDSEINYYHSDRIQSNRLVTDFSGSVEKEFKSLPFGQEISNSGVKYAFATGKELDESDLYYFGARYYDSDLGRFTSVDPVKENEPYSYVRNNPLNLVDPNGKDQEESTGEQLYNWAEEQIDESAFVFGGRGEYYYDKNNNWKREKTPAGLKGYDCIGLPIVGLSKIYNSKISNFPPNLKLIEKLEQDYGWSSYIVEPSSVNGEAATTKDIGNIPKGSIVFLMHDIYGGSESIEGYEEKKRDEKFYTHVDKEGNRNVLEVGHTLIKGAGNLFINAIPGSLKYTPYEAYEYNQQSSTMLFQGPVRVKGLLPRHDHLLVIAPPSNNE